MANLSMINVAIDHGTCNSAIAVMEARGPRIIPDGGFDTLASYVFISDRGVVSVGRNALDAVRQGARGDSASNYKTSLGRGIVYDFPASGQKKADWEIAGIVLKKLREMFRDDMKQELLSAVITVPAEFSDEKRDATVRAACDGAGLLQVETLQEQIAAAKAYGFDERAEDGTLVIFDMGAGTTDVSLLSARHGKVEPIHGAHAGNAQLGGQNFDARLEDLVLERAELTRAAIENPALLRVMVEQLKIALSSAPTKRIDVPVQKNMEKEVTIKVAEYESLINSDVNAAVQLCQGLLDRHSLRSSEMRGVILIGGPSKTPLVRRKLTELFGDRLLDRIDPMTAVARGGAIYAATRRLTEKVSVALGLDRTVTAADQQDFRISFSHPPESQSLKCTVTVELSLEGAQVPPGLSVQIRRDGNVYDSGRVPLNEDGSAEIPVLLASSNDGRAVFSSFQTTVFDAAGNEVACKDGPAIWYKLHGGGRSEMSNSIGVGVLDEEWRFHNLKTTRFLRMFPAGTTMPDNKKATLYSTVELQPGATDSAINVPIVSAIKNLFLEEEDDVLCHRIIGELTIKASDQRVTRTVPAGTAIEVRIQYDDAGVPSGSARVELLDDAEFKLNFNFSGSGETPQLTAHIFRCIKTHLKRVRETQTRKPNPKVADGLAKIDEAQLVESIEEDQARVESLPPSGRIQLIGRIYDNVHRLTGTVTQLHRLQSRERAQVLAESLGNSIQGEGRRTVEELQAALVKAVAANDANEIRSIDRHLQDLDIGVRCAPYHSVCASVKAIAQPNHRCTQSQIALYHKADKAWDEIIERGGIGSLTEEDLDRFQALDRELNEAFRDELPKWIEDLRKFEQGQGVLTDKGH